MALIEVAAPIAEKIDATKRDKMLTLPVGRMAMVIHTGSYDVCGLTYDTVFA